MDFDEYIKQVEPHKRSKGYAWQTAIGLQAVDGLKPSSSSSKISFDAQRYSVLEELVNFPLN